MSAKTEGQEQVSNDAENGSNENAQEGRGFSIDVLETTSGFVQVTMRMPADEAKTLFGTLNRKRVRAALCAAAESVELDKALVGSWYCVHCTPFVLGGGSHSTHNVNKKDWFSAFLDGFGICEGPSFHVHDGRCSGSHA